MTALLASLWRKIQAPVLIVIAIGGAILTVLRQARRDGVNQVLVEQQEKRDELQRHYDQIDSGPVDVDHAYDRLRDRSKSRR